MPRHVFLAALTALAGCQHIQLQNHALRQASTLTDLQYKEVLGNLAMFSRNPNSLPYYLLTGTGTTTITDTVNPTTMFGWDKLLSGGGYLPFQFDKASQSISVTNTSTETWTTAGVLNPDALLHMRCVYQMTVGAPDSACDCENKVREYFQRTPCYMEAMRPGWFCVGRLKDVPKDAAYVGRYGLTFAWVMPENVDYLTKLTLAILDIATAIEPGKPGAHSERQ